MTWDEYFIKIAEVVSRKSKDPSSKIGAVIVTPEHEIVATGFNGFPRGINEYDPTRWERPIKYKYVEHAERNACYSAAKRGASVQGCTLYLTGFGPPTVPCVECTKAVIQSGITTIKGYAYKPAPDNWLDDLAFAQHLLQETNVEFIEL